MTRPATAADAIIDRHPWLGIVLWVAIIVVAGLLGAIE